MCFNGGFDVIEESILTLILAFIYRRLQYSSDEFPVDVGQTSAGPVAISAHCLTLVLVLSGIIDSNPELQTQSSMRLQ